MEDGFLYQIMTMVARRLPMLLFAAGAIIFALVRWRVNPRASLITAVAFAIYLIDAFAYSTFLYFVPDILTRPLELTPSGQRWMYSVIYFLEDIVMAVVIILLTAAAFIGRNHVTPKTETI